MSDKPVNIFLTKDGAVGPKYPGVSVSVTDRFEMNCKEIRARLIVYSMQLVQDLDLEMERDPEGLLAHAVEKSAEAAMLYAAAMALPFVGLNWSKLITLGMRLVRSDDKTGTVELVDRGREQAAINWGRTPGAGGEVFSFQDILERLEDRSWRVA